MVHKVPDAVKSALCDDGWLLIYGDDSSTAYLREAVCMGANQGYVTSLG